MKTNYQSLAEKIKASQSAEDCERIDKLMTQVYDAGQLTASELKRLDLKNVDRRIELHLWC